MKATLERPKTAVEMLMRTRHKSIELVGGTLDGKKIPDSKGVYKHNPAEIYLFSGLAYRPSHIGNGVLYMTHDPMRTQWYAKLLAKKALN